MTNNHRRRADTNTHISTNREIASWTLNRNFRSSVDSQIDDKSLKTLNRSSKNMRYDLIASDDEILQASSGGIKRTKSFWKFGGGRHDDILAGMSLWQHRDLVAAPNMEELRDEGYRTTSSKMESERELDANDTLNKSNSNNSSSSQEKHLIEPGRMRKESVTSLEMYDEDENIYGLTPMVREPMITRPSNGSNNFTPKSRMKIMKTIEIDIENPAESERLSTIKRNQKEYRDTATNRHSLMDNNNKQNSLNKRAPSNNHKKAYDVQKTAQNMVQNKNMNGQNRNSKQPDMFPSTESEAGESELDNGTLKMSDVNNFFDNNGNNTNGGIIMKTVKRKDILKQYYTSEDDSDDPEIKSTSSDPYDCIVINDHLVRRDEKQRRALQMQEHQMEFQTFRASTSTNLNNGNNNMNMKKKPERGERHHERRNVEDGERNRSNKSYDQQEQMRYNDATLTRQSNTSLNTPTATILPRTRLMKSSNMSQSMTLERNTNGTAKQKSQTTNGDRDKHYGKTYGPWYDFWDHQDQQDHHQQQQQQPQNQSTKNNKMK